METNSAPTPLPEMDLPVGREISMMIDRCDDEELVLSLIGQLNFNTAQLVARPITQRIAQQPVKRLVLDCRQVVFVDSQALVMLLTLSRACRGKGGELIIRNPMPMVLNILKMTKLDSLFTIDHTEGDPPPMPRVPLSFFPTSQ